MSGSFQIGARQIGPGCPVYVIAEVSANHNQNFDQAVHIVQAAGQAGAITKTPSVSNWAHPSLVDPWLTNVFGPPGSAQNKSGGRKRCQLPSNAN